MISSSTAKEVHSVWFFSRRQQPNDKEVEEKLAVIQDNIQKTSDKADESFSKLATELEALEKTDDITLNIFLAMGGDKRTIKK